MRKKNRKKMNTALAFLMAAVFGLTSFSPAVMTYAAGETEAAAVEEPAKEQEDRPYGQSVTVKKDLKVTAKADAGVLPNDAKLKVEPITKGDDYKEIEKKVRKDVQDDDRELSGFLAYDISFEVDGQETEPNGKVDVTMEWDKAALPDDVEKGAEVSVLHLTDDDEVVDLTQNEVKEKDKDKDNIATVKTTGDEKSVRKMEMTVDGFSVFTITWTKANAVRKAAPASTPDALNVEDYVTTADFSYVDSNKQNVSIDDDTIIPDTATEFSIMVGFGNVPTLDLKNNHSRTLYYTLPSQLTNPTLTGNDILDQESNKIGTINIQDGQVVMVFNDDYLTGDANSKTRGEFTFRCNIDRTEYTDNPMTITIGKIKKELNFQVREIAETGELSVEKSEPVYVAGDDAANEGYLEYTLTVKTGEDAMPDVRVEDSVTSGGSYVAGYLVAGTLADGTTVTTKGNVLAAGSTVTVPAETEGKSETTVSITGSNPGSMTWKVGNMGANERRTLTYRIKLKQNYVGLYNTNPLVNTAKPYAKTYQHGQDSKSFTPKEGATVTKTVGDISENDDGTKISIPYTIEVKANADNTWPIRNIKIADNLYNTYLSSNTSTGTADREAVCKYARFADFVVYEEAADGTKTELSRPTANASDGKLKTYYETSNAYNPRYDLYAGDVNPNAALVITYNIVVDKALFTARNGSWTLKNNAGVYTDDNYEGQPGGNVGIGSGSSNKMIGTEVLDRKVMGEQLTEETTQTPPEGQTATTIPAGAIKYQVVVNETGGWNLSEASFKDTLGEHLNFTGYLQIDYYAEGITYAGSGENVTIPTDAQAIAALQAKQPTKTVYVAMDDIDNADHSTFTLVPKDHDLTQKSGAYLLTYYAVPVDIGGVTQFSATNGFGVEGTVYGPGGKGAITSAGTTIRTTRTLSGGANYSYTKRGWYYDSYNNDAYWIIEAYGGNLPAGLALQDRPGSGNNTPQIVGAYIGTVDTSSSAGRHIDEVYNTFGAFQRAVAGNSSFRTLEQGSDKDFTWENPYTYKDSNEKEITSNYNTFVLQKEQALTEGQKLYVIVRTKRNVTVSDKRGLYTLQNDLYVKEAGVDEVRKNNTASLSTKGGGDIFKELGEVIRKNDQGQWSQITAGETTSKQSTSNLLTDRLTEAGTYIEWRIKMNMFPNLTGSYDVTDVLPEGVDPVYLWYFWINTSTNTADNAPEFERIEELENNSAWTDIGIKNAGIVGVPNGTKYNAYAYYNSSTRQIRFRVRFRQPWVPQSSSTANYNDQRSLELQLVGKVDGSIYLSKETESFTNTVSMTDSNGDNIGTDTQTTSISLTTLDKNTSITNATINGRVPFTLTLNPLGEDLVPGTDTLTVTDELKDPLVLDLDSVKVTDGSDNDVTREVTVQNGGRISDDTGTIWRFVVPDNKKLTIYYETVPYVALHSTFTAGNTAYWSGTSGSVRPGVNQSAENAAAASATTDHKPSITVTKRDANQMATVLSGAEFTLTQVELDTSVTPNSWKEVEGGLTKTGTTSDNGTLTFDNLDYDTAYKLEETKAPDGYDADTLPKYIVVAKNTGSTADPVYADVVKNYAANGATVQYTGEVFKIDVADTPKDIYELGVTIKKVDKDNSETVLQGASFRLFRMNGDTKEYFISRDDSTNEITWAQESESNTPQTFTTDSDGTISLGMFPRKKSGSGYEQKIYYLEETAAPVGYNKLTKPISFMVNSSGALTAAIAPNGRTLEGVEIDTSAAAIKNTEDSSKLAYTITISNTPGADLPKAGGTGTRVFTVIGLLLIFTAGILLGRRGYLKRHKTKN